MSSLPQVAQNAPPEERPALRLVAAGPRINARIQAFIDARWAAVGKIGQAPLSDRLVFRKVLGVRRVSGGYAANLQYVYHGRQPEPYTVEGYVTGYDDGPLTGESYARSCTCPDFEKKRGPARDDLRGEARCCKHMILFQVLAGTWRGRLPRGGILGMAYPAPPPAPEPPFTEEQAAVLAAPGRKSNYREGSKAGYRMGKQAGGQ